MQKPTLHSLILGFSPTQHAALSKTLRGFGIAVNLNAVSLKPQQLKQRLLSGPVDVVFILKRTISNREHLARLLSKNNHDCILVELIHPDASLAPPSFSHLLQACKVVYDPARKEFLLALKFVLQYTVLKKEFRHCKSLLLLSETRAHRLVDTSSRAIAYIAQGRILHANIPFLVLFAASSMEEMQRFSLLRLISKDEHALFAKYLAGVNKAPGNSTSLTLTMRRISGSPFNARIQVSPVVLKGQRCYQIWADQITKAGSKDEMIPTARPLNIWDLPLDQGDVVEVNPFDDVLGLSGTQSRSSLNQKQSTEILLDELQQDEEVGLRMRELHAPGRISLNMTWVDLDVPPEQFKKVNMLLSRLPVKGSSVLDYTSFWEQLKYRLLFSEVTHVASPTTVYLVELNKHVIANADAIIWLFKLLSRLGDRAQQLTLMVDANIPMSWIPQTQKVISLLRSSGCSIALNNFSVDTTPLFLYRKIQPERLIFDRQWLEGLKQKPQGNLFLSKFIQQLKRREVSVVLPFARQKHQNRLLVLPGSSFCQENPTQGWA